jgi:hypothetical protein
VLVIRRSLRIGVRLGAVAAVGFVIYKILQARRPSPALPEGGDPWASPASAPRAAEPALVQPTMLESTALRRRPAPEADEPEAPTTAQSPGTGTALTEPPVVDRPWASGSSPAAPAPRVPARQAPPPTPPAAPEEPDELDLTSTAPPVVAAMAPTASAGPEIAPDDDEVVILDEGGAGDGRPAVNSPPAPEPAADAPAKAAATPPSRAGATPTPTARANPPVTPTAKAPAKAVPAKAAAATKKARPAKKAAKKAAKAAKAAGGAKAARATRRTPAAKSGRAAKAARQESASAWVEPQGRVCPTTHPVKAKLRSAMFHLPGMGAYDRTIPDRCYRDEAAATADGLRRATR